MRLFSESNGLEIQLDDLKSALDSFCKADDNETYLDDCKEIDAILERIDNKLEEANQL